MVLPHIVRLGMNHVYLLPGAAGYLLIDAGPRGCAESFRRSIRRFGISLRQIRLVLVTHVHFDHVGSLQAIQKKCGAQVLVHHADAGLLHRGQVVLPPGTQPLTRRLIRLRQPSPLPGQTAVPLRSGHTRPGHHGPPGPDTLRV